MFGPKKKKIADLDVDEVMRAIAPLIGGGIHEPGQVTGQPSFAPTVQDEPVNMGFGRTMESVPSGVPASTPGLNPTVTTSGVPAAVSPVTFAPRSRQQELDVETAKNDELHRVGAPKERSLAKRLLQGALRGFATGGIGGAIAGTAIEGFYPKANTQIRTQSEIAQSDKRIGGLQKAVGLEEDSLYKKARINDIEADNKRQQQEGLRKQTKDDRDYEIKSQTLDWKKEDRERYYELEDVKREAKAKNDDRTYDLAVKKQVELERHNGVSEKQAAINEQGRNTRTDKIIGGATTRTQMTINARQELQKHALQYGREKTISDATNNFKTEFLKVNGKPPTQADIEVFINTAVIPELDAEGEVGP